jgi:hypothetical protein
MEQGEARPFVLGSFAAAASHERSQAAKPLEVITVTFAGWQVRNAPWTARDTSSVVSMEQTARAAEEARQAELARQEMARVQAEALARRQAEWALQQELARQAEMARLQAEALARQQAEEAALMARVSGR